MLNCKRYKRKINSFLYEHIWLKYGIDYAWVFLISIISAAFFALGINLFLSPSFDTQNTLVLVSGGVSGVAQISTVVAELILGDAYNADYKQLIYSITYLIINIPLLILAFKGISLRFGLSTLVNVLSVSLFISVFQGPFFDDLARFISEQGGLLARAMFAGVCTGLSSAISYKYESSAGGFDIVSYYYSLRKSTSAGKYGALINSVVVSLFLILSAVNGTTIAGSDPWVAAIGGLLFTIIYLLVVMLLVDLINVRNKKLQLQIITGNPDVVAALLRHIPHGATVIDGKGAFSNSDKKIIYMVISSLELKKVTQVIRQIDPDSFVNVTPLQQVYGRFFIKPVR